MTGFGQSALGLDAVGGGQLPGRIQGHQIVGDQRARGRRALAGGIVGAGGRGQVDDPLAGGVFDRLALRALQLVAKLIDPRLQEAAGVAGGVEAALQIDRDIVLAPGLGDLLRQLRRGRHGPDIHQARSPDRRDADAQQQDLAGDLLALGAPGPAGMPGEVVAVLELLEEAGIVDRAEVLGHPFGQGLGVQEAVLGLVEFLVADRGVALDAVDVHHPGGFPRDLQAQGRGVLAGHQEGDEQPKHRAADDAADQHPAPPRGHAQEPSQRRRPAGGHILSGAGLQQGDVAGGKAQHLRGDTVHGQITRSRIRISGVVSIGETWMNCWIARRDLESPTTMMSWA